MHKLFILIISFTVALAISCKKECDTDLREPIISTDEPITEGDELILVARGEADDTYSWTGPNEFVADGKVVNLGPANEGMEGLYKVVVSRKGCNERSSTRDLEILNLSPPCFPPAYEIDIDKYPTIEGSVVKCNYDSTREAYTVNFSSLYGSFYVIFSGDTPPEFDQTYLAAGESDSLSSNQVRIEVFTGEQPNLKRYYGLNGNVYCTVMDDFMEIIVCDLACNRIDGLIYVTGRIGCGI